MIIKFDIYNCLVRRTSRYRWSTWNISWYNVFILFKNLTIDIVFEKYHRGEGLMGKLNKF